MAESRGCSAAHGGARGPLDEAQDQMAVAVEEAQVELDRLMDLLAEEGQPDITPGSLPSLANKAVDLGGSSGETGRTGDASPLYLIISSRRALTAKYGRLGFERVDSDLRELQQAAEDRADLETVVLYVDDQDSLERYSLTPVDPANPYKIKMLIDELDAQLADAGVEIRYLLIVGGDKIIPFHRLPNPVDDHDTVVPSDNPYACRDKSYLVPDRAVGRLPDGDDGRSAYALSTSDASVGFLHTLIQVAASGHRDRAVAKGLPDVLRSALRFLKPEQTNGRGLGYSASIWRKASRAVFLTIGGESQLRISPPLTHEGFSIVDRPHFSYFNLHGIEDGPNWYGQRDSLFPADYPLFPLALRPQDLGMDDYVDSVVLTEACYGANILGKTTGDSIALRLLAGRALAVVGSTKASYGSIAPPLLAADLIGKYFWEGLQARLNAGDALKYAKVNLAREMQQRQGYLDGEDQKALVSFVLYGDPLLPITAVQRRASVAALGKSLCPPIVCGRETAAESGVLSDELVASVKGSITTSLPYMRNARVRAKPVGLCHGVAAAAATAAATAAVHSLAGGRPEIGPGRWALTLEKELPVEENAGRLGRLPLHQVVKVVVDENGHIVKMAVSR